MPDNSISSFSEEVSGLLPYLMKGIFNKNLDVMGMGKITIPQFMALNLIDFHKSVKMKDIAKNLNISLPAGTGLISRLHRTGIIKRIYDKNDRRVIYIELTQKGVQIVKKLREQKIKMIENLFSKLSEKERADYLNVLRKLKQAVENENIKR